MPPLICRSRTGCFTCRGRKKKCNEEKPTCSGCRRNDLECRWPARLSSSSAKRLPKDGHVKANTTGTSKPGSSAAGSSSTARGVILRPRPASFTGPIWRDKEFGDDAAAAPVPRGHSFSTPRPADLLFNFAGHLPALDTIMVETDELEEDDGSNFPTAMDAQNAVDLTSTSSSEHPSHPSPSASSPSPASTSSSATSVVLSTNTSVPDGPSVITNLDTLIDGSPGLEQSMQDQQLSVAKSLPLFPQYSSDSSDLLGFYLDRTANCMGNGSTDSNPFITKLVPLAFSHSLLLQLIMAQGAVHRQMSKDRHPSDELARRSYSDSLRYFRTVVQDHVSGREENTLVLTVGSLILSLTEVARGDSHGSTFDHIGAAKSLLTKLLTSPRRDVSEELRGFLVEYYTHMAALSIISMGTRCGAEPCLDPDMERLANDLVEKQYVGQLCGCWLELLVSIPKIFVLGQRMMAESDNDQPRCPSPDDITNFGFLQSQVLAFYPNPSASLETALAGLVFKQAVLLYLWTMLAGPHQMNDNNSMHRDLIQSTVTEAMSLLSQFPASTRINTSLCWPLVVIGCCLSEPDVQQVLRSRLQTMVDTIALGNMRETLLILEHVWTKPPEERNPWTLCNTMQELQILISFA